jgi:hypothetical protein
MCIHVYMYLSELFDSSVNDIRLFNNIMNMSNTDAKMNTDIERRKLVTHNE